MNTITAM